MSYFNYNLHNAFKIRVPNLVTVDLLLFTKSQFRTNAQNFLHLHQCTHGHIRLWNGIVPFRRSPGGYECFDRHTSKKHKTSNDSTEKYFG
jgi:hypothetical protein